MVVRGREVLRIYWPFLVIFTAGHSVGPLSVLTERGERATKGLGDLWKPPNTGVRRGDVRTLLRIRRNAFDAIKSRMACSALLPCALRAAP